MQLEVGQRINDYEILSILGAGGMGRVYSVRNNISGRTEAMKVLLPDLSAERDLAERFISEIRTLASFDHPNIAQLRTAFLFENQLVMVMEFVEGVTLEQQARKGPMPVADVVGYISQALSALSYAHGRGVVHRDIKPANMMVTSHGIVKLMDFGIAKSSNEPQLTRPGTTIGSMYYMSPEQVRGDTIDARSDIYSVGITLYELLAGRKPFAAESTFSILNQQLNEAPKPLIEVNPGIPVGLSHIVQLALAKNSSQRFQTADAFRNSLKPFLQTAQETATTWAAAVPATPPAAPAAAEYSAVATPPPPGYAPGPAASAPAGYAPAAAQTVKTNPKSRRGLWIGLGAAAAIVAVVLAITILPRVLTTHAANEAAVTSATPTASPAPSATSAAAPNATTAAAPDAAASAQPPGTPAPTAGSAPDNTPVAAMTPDAAVPQTEKVPHSSPAKPRPAYISGVQSGLKPPDTPPPAAGNEEPSGNSQAALDAASDRLIQVQARASAVNDSIDHLRRQQEQAGYGLRGDISAAVSRMNAYQATANRAIAEKNAALADKSLDQAEKELETLEKFLGR